MNPNQPTWRDLLMAWWFVFILCATVVKLRWDVDEQVTYTRAIMQTMGAQAQIEKSTMEILQAHSRQLDLLEFRTHPDQPKE